LTEGRIKAEKRKKVQVLLFIYEIKIKSPCNNPQAFGDRQVR